MKTFRVVFGLREGVTRGRNRLVKYTVFAYDAQQAIDVGMSKFLELHTFDCLLNRTRPSVVASEVYPFERFAFAA